MKAILKVKDFVLTYMFWIILFSFLILGIYSSSGLKFGGSSSDHAEDHTPVMTY